MIDRCSMANSRLLDVLLVVLGVRLYRPLRRVRDEDGIAEMLESHFLREMRPSESFVVERRLPAVTAASDHVRWSNMHVHLAFLLYRVCIALMYASFLMETIERYKLNRHLDVFFMNMLIDVLCCMHWFLAIDYFSTGHLEALHGDEFPEEPRSDDNPLAFDHAIREECGFTRNAMALTVSCVTIVQIVVSIAFDESLLLRTTSLPLHPWAIFARAVIGNFLGRGVVFLNCMVFSTTFVKHTQAMSMYTRSMSTPEWFDPQDPSSLVLRTAEICYNMACLKSSVVTSSRKLDKMVGSVMFVVPASLGCFANTVSRVYFVQVTAEVATMMGFFGLVICIMAYVILRYEELKTRMCCIIESPRFIEMYITPRPDDARYSLACHYHLLLTELVKTSNWMSISVLGMSISDGAIMQRALLVGGVSFGVMQAYAARGQADGSSLVGE